MTGRSSDPDILRHDRCVQYVRSYRLIHKEIIETPPIVLFPCIVLERPPGIMTGFPVKHPECIGKTELDKAVDFPPLVRGNANLLDRLFGRIVEILIGVRHVEIAADDHREVCRDLPDVGKECIVEPQLVVEVSHRFDPEREIDVEQEKRAVICNKDAPCIIKLGIAKTKFYGQGFLPGKEPDPCDAPRRNRKKYVW